MVLGLKAFEVVGDIFMKVEKISFDTRFKCRISFKYSEICLCL